MHEAHASEWEPQLYIETEVLNKIALWVTAQFNETTERFEETSDIIYDRHFMVSSGGGSSLNISAGYIPYLHALERQ